MCFHLLVPSQWPHQLGLGQAETRNFFWVSHWYRGPRIWVVFCCFPKGICRMLNWMGDSQDLNWTHMGCHFNSQWFYLLNQTQSQDLLETKDLSWISFIKPLIPTTGVLLSWPYCHDIPQNNITWEVTLQYVDFIGTSNIHSCAFLASLFQLYTSILNIC